MPRGYQAGGADLSLLIERAARQAHQNPLQLVFTRNVIISAPISTQVYRIMKRTFLALACSLPALALAAPLAAQDTAGDKVNMVIAYGEDECPEPTGDEIVVCEILVEAERYRIPTNLRESRSPQNEAWAKRVQSLKVIGNFGTHSCSPSGAGGLTGCTQKMIDEAYAEKREGSAVRFAQLIAEARAERLADIDDDAAAEQERVEQIEREYLERLERERQAPLPGEEGAEGGANAPPPLPTPGS
jgi:hypothetical protein